MSDCRFGVSPVNYPDPDPEREWPVPSKFIINSNISLPTVFELGHDKTIEDSNQPRHPPSLVSLLCVLYG